MSSLYLHFLNEKTKEGKTHVSFYDLFDFFKIWFKNNNPNKSLKNLQRLLDNFFIKYKILDMIYSF